MVKREDGKCGWLRTSGILDPDSSVLADPKFDS